MTARTTTCNNIHFVTSLLVLLPLAVPSLGFALVCVGTDEGQLCRCNRSVMLLEASVLTLTLAMLGVGWWRGQPWLYGPACLVVSLVLACWEINFRTPCRRWCPWWVPVLLYVYATVVVCLVR